MSLSDDEYTELQTILQGLDVSKLYTSAQNFVNDQIEREKQYGQDIRMSPKQWAWLRKIYDEFGEKPQVVRKMTDEEAGGDDLDDEIPF